MIIIRHSHADGTVLTGSAKGDGVYEIVRQHGFTYRPRPGIFIRGSRDKPAQVDKIEAAAAALRAAGFEVDLDIDDTPRPAAVREADWAERAATRADRLTRRAESTAARGAATYRAGRDRLDRIPLGQPILTDHHSAGRDRRDRDRALGKIEAGLVDLAQADRLAGRAEAVRTHQQHRTDPRVIKRRLERLEADRRARTRRGQDTEQLEADITYWRGVLADYETTGEHVAWGPTSIAKGDTVLISDSWYEVVRVNPKSVTVPPVIGMGSKTAPSGARYSWTDRVGYDKIHGRRRGGQQLDEPNGRPWPVELADKVARWDRLQHTLSLPSSQGSDPESVNRRTLAGRAQRFALGLPATASEAEVAAFTAPDLATARALAAACIDIYDRLKAGDQPGDIVATISPVDCGEPDWRMPTGEPTDRRADQLKPGDIIAGCWDRDFAGRRLVTSFTGPVEQVSAVVDRHERGRWVTVQLLDGSQRSYQTHVWFSVFPDAYPH